MITEEQKEQLGQAIDRVANIEGALSLPMPAQFHIDQLKSLLPEIREQLRDAYVEIAGDDPWEFHPDRIKK